jgi:hypothetical protein
MLLFVFKCRKGKDCLMAILEKMKPPNLLVLDEATNHDNSVMTLHPDTMDTLQLFHYHAGLGILRHCMWFWELTVLVKSTTSIPPSL